MSYLRILGTTNLKSAKTEKEHPDVMIRTFSLPPSAMTCPNAGICKDGCYACKGRMALETAKNSYRENLAMVLDGSLWKQLDAELTVFECQAKRLHKRPYVRVHGAGDFFDYKYTVNWFCFMRAHPDITFYAYTKMVSMFHSLEDDGAIPTNFHYVLSRGGIEDDLIGSDDRIADVFLEIIPPTHADGSHDDLLVCDENIMRIGLRYHGPANAAFETY